MRRMYIVQQEDAFRLLEKFVKDTAKPPPEFEVFKILMPTADDPFFRVYLTDEGAPPKK